MNECFDRVLTKIAKYLNNNGYPNLKVTSLYFDVPPTLPHVSITQVTDSVKTNTLNLDSTHFNVSFQIDIYSNSPTDKVAEINDIAEKINNVMSEIHFIRVANHFINNAEPTIARKMIRYRRRTITKQEIEEI